MTAHTEIIKHPFTLEDFVRESNRIEKMYGDPTRREIEAHENFLSKSVIDIVDLEEFVFDVQYDAQLRRFYGLDVKVGGYYPPPGGPTIVGDLERVLAIEDPFRQHVEYEKLHPFTDGNGRSGRALWLHAHGGIEYVPYGFLNTFYFQTLINMQREL